MHLSEEQADAIREIFSIGIGRAAATLSELMGTRIEMAVPRVVVRMSDDPAEPESSPSVGPEIVIIQDFRGKIAGRSALALPHASGLRLAQLLGDVAEPVDELDLEMSGILTEVGNIMLNSVLGVLANAIGTFLVYGVPHCYSERPITALLSREAHGPGAVLVADADFWVRHDSIHGSLLVAMEPQGLETILDAICEVEI